MKVGDEYVLMDPAEIGCLTSEKGSVLRVMVVEVEESYSSPRKLFVANKIKWPQEDAVGETRRVYLNVSDERNGVLIKLRGRDSYDQG